MSDIAVQWVVVCVHGTWDTRALWTRNKSPFFHYIQSRFSGVCFNRLVWSGENSCLARLKAADRLEKRLHHLRRAYPTAKLIVIAHSHGGNIALYACRRHDVDKIVDGVICIGTPFISAQAQAIFGDMPLAFFTTGFLASLAGICLAPMALVSIGFYMVALLSLAAITRRHSFRRDYGLYYDLREAESLCDRLTINEPPSTSLLIVTTEGDEASVVLAVSQAARWAGRALVEFPQSLPIRMSMMKYDVRRTRSNLQRWGISVLEFAGLIIGNVLSSITLPLALVVHMISLRVLGIRLMRDALLVEATAEPFPPGEATCVRIRSESVQLCLGKRSHSDSLNNDRVFYAISRWMMNLTKPTEETERKKRWKRFYGMDDSEL